MQGLRSSGWLALRPRGGRFRRARKAEYPERQITVVVPFAAGGPTDIISRLVAEPMSKTLGQNIVVENQVGAGGTVAVTRVKNATPDGYTHPDGQSRHAGRERRALSKARL